MFTRPSQEFLTLCQGQLSLLQQTCGAALSAVYLAEDFTGEHLVPVMVCPDPGDGWQPEMVKPQDPIVDSNTLGQLVNLPQLGSFIPRFPDTIPLLPDPSAYENNWQDEQGTWQRQVVIPLVHEDLVMGLLVTGRSDRPWQPREMSAIEKVAHTLAIARLLDQRAYWLDQQLNQQKLLAADHQDHLDNLLHQIRNPLTAIKTFGKLLLKRLLPADANRSIITGIVQESDRLQFLLQQLDQEIELEHQELAQGLVPALTTPQIRSLPPARSELGQPLEPLVLKSIDLSQVLTPLLISAQAIAQDRDLEIIIDISPVLPLIIADASALREVLSNLLDNALKYTPAQGSIFVKNLELGKIPPAITLQLPEHNTNFLYLGITNTGAGIPVGDLPSLFLRHYRGVQETGTIGGSGLGLAIAKQLLEQMGGEITALSPADPAWAKGQGENYNNTLEPNRILTTFLVCIPLAPSH